jgi:hypothetical protein
MRTVRTDVMMNSVKSFGVSGCATWSSSLIEHCVHITHARARNLYNRPTPTKFDFAAVLISSLAFVCEILYLRSGV